METFKSKFNRLIANLKLDINLSNLEPEPTDYIKILEPTCNLEFVNRLIGITTVGLIVTQQYDYDNDSIMINEFSDVIERHDREMIIELLTQHIK